MQGGVSKRARERGGARTGIVHVREEPLHGGVCVGVAGREQRFVAAEGREAHRLELGQRGLVEGGQPGRLCGSSGSRARAAGSWRSGHAPGLSSGSALSSGCKPWPRKWSSWRVSSEGSTRGMSGTIGVLGRAGDALWTPLPSLVGTQFTSWNFLACRTRVCGNVENLDCLGQT